MSKPMSRWQRATAILPLALLSAAWTVTVVGGGGANAEGPLKGRLPDGSVMPKVTITDPVSVSPQGSISRAVPKGQARAVLNDRTQDVPDVALAAYRRAETIIGNADPACNLRWDLLAAIGRVESDHGRHGGGFLTDKGLTVPYLYGVPLDGTRGTRPIRDTDGGQLDGDKTWDRAVGPLQFIPSTWALVGVDADGDGKRNPQDIHDASLAAAVYLCSGEEDLSTRAGQRTAVFRYNNSNEYVRLVLALMEEFGDGNYSYAPNRASPGYTIPPSEDTYNYVPETGSTLTNPPPYNEPRPPKQEEPKGPQGEGKPDDKDPVKPPKPPRDEEPEDKPSDPVEEVEDTVKETLTPLEKATKYCLAEGVPQGELEACAQAYMEGGEAAVQRLLDGLLGLPTLPGLPK